jgi:hypothetical protein
VTRIGQGFGAFLFLFPTWKRRKKKKKKKRREGLASLNDYFLVCL